MLARMVLVTFCVLVPSTSWAQTVQENYLPSHSQLYFRWDGMTVHQAAFDKTGAGKMMNGETGKFLAEFGKYLHEQIKNASRNEPKVGDFFDDAFKLIKSIHREGIVVGVAVTKITPQPQIQAVMVFPKAAGESGTVLQLIDKIARETMTDVKLKKVGKRRVHSIEKPDVNLGWWAEGQDAVLYFGTLDPGQYAANIDAKTTGLANHPLYQQVAGFKEFTTCTRGFINFTSVFNVVSDIRIKDTDISPIINDLGLKGFKHLTFVTGFDGPSERSVVDLEVAEERTGLLSLGSKKKISLKDLPALPDDMTSLTASTVNLSKTYDVITNTIYSIVKVADPNELENVKDKIKQVEDKVGVNINKDLFGSFGDVVVMYNSPSDGFLGAGSVTAIQLKDGKKLDKTLDKLFKAIGEIPNAPEVIVKRKTYHGGEVVQVILNIDQGFQKMTMPIASYGIYKNWFIYAGTIQFGITQASFPQPIKGFILRQEGVLPAWKADESLTKVLAQFPKEFNGIRVADPRSGIQTLLSIAPFALNLTNTFGSAFSNSPIGKQFLPNFRPFDLELIPHAQEATRYLLPSVSITNDNGKRIRTETRGSL